MTSRTFTVSKAMNPDWVRADGLTAGAGTDTSTSRSASLLGADEKKIQCPSLTLVNRTSMGLTGSCSEVGTLGTTRRR